MEAEINKKADAERYKVEQEAAATLAKRQREAEAKKYEQEKEAEAMKAKAQAEADAMKAKALAEAEALKAKAEATRFAAEQEATGIRAKGEAEAASIQAKALAEAEGMEKKAEAYSKYDNAAILEMLLSIMPQMAAEIAKPLASISKVNIYGGGGDSGSGISQVSGNAATVMQQVFDTMSEATGVDFREILKAQTYDAKVTRNLNFTGLPDTKQADSRASSSPDTQTNLSQNNSASPDKGNTDSAPATP